MQSNNERAASGMSNAGSSSGDEIRISPAAMPQIGRVDERYQSYNVEMAEVIGGNFWRPYDSMSASERADLQGSPSSQQDFAGIQIGEPDSGMFEARPPVDLANRRLRNLAAALGPAYMRVSGTWANSAYFHDSDEPAPSTPPQGFQSVLTRQQWAGVLDFARVVDAKLMTSFAISAGVRDADGVWTADQATKVVERTRALGGEIAAAELFNEPNLAMGGGAPPDYDALMFDRDQTVFREFLESATPGTLAAGPGSMSEGIGLFPPGAPMLNSEDMLAGPPPPAFDVFSYHFYGAVSERCAAIGPERTTTFDAALSEEWLARTDKVYSFYSDLRDRFQPDRPMWLSETAETACGGNPWSATFVDSFRYLDQLGRLARQGLSVHFHNTLASSEYGLIDQESFTPRPNYWAALLWRRFMGTQVLDPGPSRSGLHLYAHNLRDNPDGVAVLVINLDRAALVRIEVPVPSERFTLTARALDDEVVQLNGRELALGPDDTLPGLESVAIPSGVVELPPASITFLVIRNARN